jgi:hypothetical protein
MAQDHTFNFGMEWPLDVYRLAAFSHDMQWPFASYRSSTFAFDVEWPIASYKEATLLFDVQWPLSAYAEKTFNLDVQWPLAVFTGKLFSLDVQWPLDAAQTFTTYAINLETFALSRYENYSFTSYAMHTDGKAYASDGDYIYCLEGEDDNGTAIQSKVLTGKMDFGTDLVKRTPYVYTAIDGGPMTFTAWFDSNYTDVEIPQTDQLENSRIHLGLGATGRYWQYQWENVGGGDFKVSGIQWLPVPLTRRI